MPYTGYCNVLPFKAGDVVLIPAGTDIHTTLRGNKRSVRKQTIVVDHTLPGSSTRAIHVSPSDRCRYPLAAQVFERLDELLLDADTNPDQEQANRLHREACDLFAPISNPTVRWAGTGGYWREADVNRLLA